MPKPILITIDDRCLESYLDVLSGKKKVSEEVLQNMIDCGRQKIQEVRDKYKHDLVKQPDISNFTNSKNRKSHGRNRSRNSRGSKN